MSGMEDQTGYLAEQEAEQEADHQDDQETFHEQAL